MEDCVSREQLEQAVNDTKLEVFDGELNEPQNLKSDTYLSSNSNIIQENNGMKETCELGTVNGIIKEQNVQKISVNKNNNKSNFSGRKRKKKEKRLTKQDLNYLLRMRGEAYMGKEFNHKNGKFTDVQKPARQLGPRCNCKVNWTACKYITDDERRDTFKRVWAMTWTEKQAFVSSLVFSRNVVRHAEIKKANFRQRSFVHRLFSKGQPVRVCKNMFISTTDLKEKFIMKHASRESFNSSSKPAAKMSQQQKDRLGRVSKPFPSDSTTDPGSCSFSENSSQGENHSGHKSPESVQDSLFEDHDLIEPDNSVKLEEPEEDIIIAFLKSLPLMPSCYCYHLASGKTYLEPVFDSLHHLYREFERFANITSSIPPPSQQDFSSALQESNYGIFKQRESDCNICNGSAQRNEKNILHLQERELALVERESDESDVAKSNGKMKMVIVNLEFVLPAPNLQNSMVYYKEKLFVHNLSFFDVASKETIYYVWHEADGTLSAQEIASCLYHYLENEADFDECIIYSDPIDYLYRNAVVAKALSYYSQKFCKTIIQKMFAEGHSHHDLVSNSKTLEKKLSVKGQSIHCPADYVRVILPTTIAQRNISQIDVRYVDFAFFKNFSITSRSKPVKPYINADDPPVHRIKALKFSSDGDVAFKLTFAGDWVEQNLKKSERMNLLKEPTALYKTKRKLGQRKYEHLQELKSLLLPDYQWFYDNLLHD